MLLKYESQRTEPSIRYTSTPPHTVTVTADHDGRKKHLDTHPDGSPKLTVRNEFVEKKINDLWDSATRVAVVLVWGVTVTVSVRW